MGHKTKNAWIREIGAFFVNGTNGSGTFTAKVSGPDKASILFACDTFRRRNFIVGIDIDVSIGTTTTLSVSIADTGSKRITLRKEDSPGEIIKSICDTKHVILRSCGTAINVMFVVITHLMNNGWFIQKIVLGSLARYVGNVKRNNTTFHVELQRGL